MRTCGNSLTDKLCVQGSAQNQLVYVQYAYIFKALHMDALLQYQVSITFVYVFSAELKNFFHKFREILEQIL